MRVCTTPSETYPGKHISIATLTTVKNTSTIINIISNFNIMVPLYFDVSVLGV